MSALRVVLVTAPDEVAETLARGLVEARLAACVGLVPGLRSIYRWQGAIEDAREVQLVIKTAASFESVRAHVRAHHPYETPEILEVSVSDADADYARWLRAEST